jgi:hypothetical protein
MNHAELLRIAVKNTHSVLEHILSTPACVHCVFPSVHIGFACTDLDTSDWCSMLNLSVNACVSVSHNFIINLMANFTYNYLSGFVSGTSWK